MFSDNSLLLYFEKTKAIKLTVVELHEKYKEKRQQDKGYKAIIHAFVTKPLICAFTLLYNIFGVKYAQKAR